MQTANIMLSLGGDSGTTVPKYGVTVSEIAVLMAIHGNSAVQDIEPGEDVERTDREEVARLRQIYGHARVQGVDGDVSVVNSLFPGAAARAFRKFDELEIPDEFFKATERVKPASTDEAPKKGRKSKAAKDEDASDDNAGADQFE